MDTAAPTQPRKRPWIIGAVAIAAGLGLVWLAWQPITETRRLAATGLRVEARVPSVEEQRRRSGSTYYPIFVFRTPEGRVVRERSAVAVDSAQAYLGRTVMVVYDPENTATVRSVASLQTGAGSTPWIAGGLALLAFAFAGLVLFAPVRTRPAR
jgi:type II secretory pathway component PulM